VFEHAAGADVGDLVVGEVELPEAVHGGEAVDVLEPTLRHPQHPHVLQARAQVPAGGRGGSGGCYKGVRERFHCIQYSLQDYSIKYL
jgi:hypothetical protein